MNRPSSSLRAALALLLFAAALVPTGAAGAQQDQRVANFWLRLAAGSDRGENHSLAMVLPDSQPADGALMWACAAEGGFVSGLRTMWSRRDGRGRTVVARFDGDAPDTLALLGERNVGVWFLDPHDEEGFTRRARAAKTLVVTVPPDSGTRSFDYTYALSGADSALSRLECGTDRGRPAGRATLQRAHETPWVHPDDRLSDDPWEEFPRIVNASDVQRYLARYYPPLLRDAGIQGEVTVKFRVLATGQVDSTSVQVMRTTHPQFDSVAMAAAARSRFRPARVYARPVSVWVTQSFSFSLPSNPAPADARRRRPRRRAAGGARRSFG